MTLIIADRIKETTATTGTGTLTLAGAMTAFRSFSAVCAIDDTCYYTIQAVDAGGVPTGEWECGVGKYSAANNLMRLSVLSSSNANNFVFFAVGTKQVFISSPAAQVKSSALVVIPVAVSDETTALTVGTGKVTFRTPFAMTLTGARASVTTAPAGAGITVDINDGGPSILSPKLTIDVADYSSVQAAVPVNFTSTELLNDTEITIDIDSVGSIIAGAGLKVYLIGYAS